MLQIMAGNSVFEGVRRGRWYVARERDLKTGETTVLKQYNYDLDGEKCVLQASRLIKRYAKVANRPVPR